MTLIVSIVAYRFMSLADLLGLRVFFREQCQLLLRLIGNGCRQVDQLEGGFCATLKSAAARFIAANVVYFDGRAALNATLDPAYDHIAVDGQ